MAQVGLLEDNMRVAHMCATMLNYVGHQVTIYKHPCECLQALLPDLISLHSKQSLYESTTMYPLPVEVLILDLYLPGIDGVEVLRHLKSHPRTQELPLIFCTAAPPSEVARAIQVVPHVAVIEKPFKLQTLTSAIAVALGAPTK